MTYKTIDLCAGIGGIRRGFELTGSFINVLSAEIDPFASATYKHLYGDDPMNDLTKEEFKKKVEQTQYDVLLAGFPCQTFSRIGKQLGFRDTTRGTIFFDIADIISRTTPRAVFLENVENLLFHDKGNTIETIIKTLEDELEYRVIGVTKDKDGKYNFDRNSLVRNTKDYGLPQNRARVYIMAFSKQWYGNAIKLLNDQLPLSSDRIIFNDLNEVLEPLVDDRYYMAQGYLDTLKRHKERNRSKGNGFGFCVVNQSGEEHPIAHTILATGGSGKERNLIFQPKDGVAGKKLSGKRTCLNSEGIRIMTPTEWGRLQGFIGYAFLNEKGEEKFSFPEGITEGQKYKQFGNSVSIPVIETMAEFMLKCFNTLEESQRSYIKSISDNRESFTIFDICEGLNIDFVRAAVLLNSMIEASEIIAIIRGDAIIYSNKHHIVKKQHLSQEKKILKLASEKDSITNADAREVLNTSIGCTNVLLSNMTRKGQLQRISKGKYRLNSKPF